VDRLDVFLHVLLDFVFVEVLESSVVSDFASCVLAASLLNNHISSELAASLSGPILWHAVFGADLVVAVSAFSLEPHGIELLLVIAVDIEDVHDGVSPAHEVRMVSVDVRVLDSDKVPNHCVGGSQFFRQKFVHALDNLLAQVLEALQLVHLNFDNHSSQLFVDKLDALQRGRLQPVDLLLRKDFECDFGDEKVRPERGGVPDGRLYVVVGQGVERVNVADSCRVVFVKDVIEATATFEL